MENMKIQWEMGAISKRTILELSPYTTDSAQELQRLEAEGIPVFNNSSANVSAINFKTDDEDETTE